MSEKPGNDAEQRQSIGFEWELPDPPEKVWRALTEAGIVSEWLAPNDLRPERGAKFSVHDRAIGREPVECEVLSIEAQRSIVFGWRDAEARRDGLDSTVTFEIAATEAGGTRLHVVHEVRRAAAPRASLGPAIALAANDNRLRLAA